jgi:glutaredoxin
MTTTTDLILYTRPECHLCEFVEAMLNEEQVEWVGVDIESDEELLARYDIHIPVLFRRDNGRELFWPFDDDDLLAFVGREA